MASAQAAGKRLIMRLLLRAHSVLHVTGRRKVPSILNAGKPELYYYY